MSTPEETAPSLQRAHIFIEPDLKKRAVAHARKQYALRLSPYVRMLIIRDLQAEAQAGAKADAAAAITAASMAKLQRRQAEKSVHVP